MPYIKSDFKAAERLTNAIKGFGDGAEKTINEYLWNDAPEIIESNIASRFPVSGRHWKKKIKSASSAGIKGVLTNLKKGTCLLRSEHAKHITICTIQMMEAIRAIIKVISTLCRKVQKIVKIKL